MSFVRHKKVYLCCGRKTGVADPDSWLGVDINEPCDLKVDVRDIEYVWADYVFATPPCDSFTDLPWRRATNKDRDILEHCMKLTMQAQKCGILECNRWAQKFVGPATFHRSSHYFWVFGDLGLVPDFKHSKQRQSGRNPLARAALPTIFEAVEQKATE